MVNRVAALAVVLLLIGGLFALLVIQPGGGGVTWANIQSFPSGCAANKYVTTVGTTLTCAQPVYANLASLPLNASKGLVGYWNFNEAQGTSAYDYSGNINTGTLTNGPTWVAGKFGSGLNFSRASQTYITIPSSSSISPTTAITLCLWFNNNGKSNPAGYGFLTKANFNTGSQDYSLELSGSGTGVEFQLNNGVIESSTTPSGLIPSNGWAFIVATYDGTVMKIYVNAVEESNTITSGAIQTSSNHLIIGGVYAPTAVINGIIDDVRIYNIALTAAQVKQLYNWVPGV